MAFDASVFAQSGRPTVAPVSPMDASAQTADMANKFFSIRQAQAQQAVGQAYQQATRPDGSLDTNKLNSIISQDPRTAMAASKAYQESEGLNTSQQARGLKANEWLNQTLPGLLALPPDQLHDATAAAMDRAVTLGLVPQAQASQALAKLPTDPGKLRDTLNSMQLAAMPAGAQRQALYGAPITTDDGQTIRGGRQILPGPGGGGALVIPQQPGVDTYPSRSTLLTQVPGVDLRDGSPTMETLGDRARQQGRTDLTGPAGRPGQVPPALLPPGYQPPAGNAAPQPAGPAGTGSAPAPAGPAGSTAAPQPNPPPPVPPAPGGAPSVAPGIKKVVTGLPLGDEQAAKDSVAHHSAATQYANAFQDRMQPLLSAQAALKDAKTGVGSDLLNTARQALATFTPGFMGNFRPFGGSPEENAAYDEANKYLIGYAAGTPGAGRSDAGGATAAASNASVKISPLAAQYVVRAAIGMERMKQAQTMEFERSGQPAARYDSYMSQNASRTDPRAFIADLQTPQERSQMWNGMNRDQRQSYLDSVRLGVRHQLMSVPQ